MITKKASSQTLTSPLLLSLNERDRDTWAGAPVVAPRKPLAVSSCCPNSSSTERTSIWNCCCRTAIVQMLGFPRTFSSGMGFQKKLRTRRFFLPPDGVAGGGGGGGAPGGGGGRGGGGGVTSRALPRESVCADMEDGSEVGMEEVVPMLSSLLPLSGSLVAGEQLMTSSTRVNTQRAGCWVGSERKMRNNLMRISWFSKVTCSGLRFTLTWIWLAMVWVCPSPSARQSSTVLKVTSRSEKTGDEDGHHGATRKKKMTGLQWDCRARHLGQSEICSN